MVRRMRERQRRAAQAAAGRQSGSAGSSGSRVQADVSRELAYSRGSSLRLSGCLRPGQQATVQLFRTAVPLPAAGMRVRLCATPAQGVKQRLALRLAPGSSSSLDVSGGSIELLPAVRHSGTGTDDGAGVSAASSSSPSSALVLAASSEHVVQQQGSTAAAAGPDAAAAAAGPDAAAPWPQWVTRSYLIGADMLAAGLAGSGDPLLLTGVDVVLLGAGRAGDGSPAPFEVHLGEAKGLKQWKQGATAASLWLGLLHDVTTCPPPPWLPQLPMSGPSCRRALHRGGVPQWRPTSASQQRAAARLQRRSTGGGGTWAGWRPHFGTLCAADVARTGGWPCHAVLPCVVRVWRLWRRGRSASLAGRRMLLRLLAGWRSSPLRRHSGDLHGAARGLQRLC